MDKLTKPEKWTMPIWNFQIRALLSLVFMVSIILLTAHPALADKRVALVIGNSSYRNVAKLSNPANDAAAVAAMFKSAGFNTVESRLNLTVSELRKALPTLATRAVMLTSRWSIMPATASNLTAPTI